MPRRLTIMAATLLGLAVSQAALAELYISPVLRDTVTYSHAPANAPAQALAAPVGVEPTPVAAQPAKAALVIKASDLASRTSVAETIRGNSTVHGAFEMQKPKEGTLFGKNVPLFVALENLVPQSEKFAIIFEPGTENIAASWSAATDYREALAQIQSRHAVSIIINDEHKRIGIARSGSTAEQIAQRGQDVWVLSSALSLRGNLELWAKQAGWKLDWGNTQVDYPIDHATSLIAQFSGADGAVDRVLNATKNREVPLTAKFYRGNNVVLIEEAGYKPEVPVSPVVDNLAY